MLIEKLSIESKQLANKEEWYPYQPRRGVEKNVKSCGICLKIGHRTYMCPILQEDTEAVQAIGAAQQSSLGRIPGQQISAKASTELPTETIVLVAT
uniref:Uncharacterized protein n=1 Tax=Lactuca sativa TaxID=4236 RepID=A0A9R1VU50_LACSA|nr:hypothetical protein LSAT_V11C400224890 [Lactuca sativa]